MPNYAMVCKKCGYTDNWFCTGFRERERMEKETVCPKCNEGKFGVDFSRGTPVFRLKGRGWSFDGYSKLPEAVKGSEN